MSETAVTETYSEGFLRMQRRAQASERRRREEKRILAAGPGYDGEDMALAAIPEAELKAKHGEAGHDIALNPETRRRRYASKFHKNIYARWTLSEKKKAKMTRGAIIRKERQFARLKKAADLALEKIETAYGGYSANAYEDTPAPDFYLPKAFTNERRAKASKWLHSMAVYVGPKFARVLKLSMIDHRTMRDIYIELHPFGKKSRKLLYRDAGMIVDAAFGALADFVEVPENA